MTPNYFGRNYHAVPPQADTDVLAAQGERLMLKHQPGAEPYFVVAFAGELTAGWVVGVFTAPWPR
jgi:hypothetical protein